MAATAPEFAGKPVADFRVYDAVGSVRDHYQQMRSNQSLAFSRRMAAKWGAFGSRPNSRMTVKQALHACDSFVDRSDPDISLPNSIHMLQAAEACRAAGKPEWFQLVALLHDIGKAMYLWGSPEEGSGGKATDPQWALGGDTWVVGAPIPDCAVYAELNALSPDAGAFAGPTGIHAPGCGIMNAEFAWGHDEYAYLWARHNKVALPAEGLAILRLHSCYPWRAWVGRRHTIDAAATPLPPLSLTQIADAPPRTPLADTGKAYRELMAPGDEALEAAVIDFNK